MTLYAPFALLHRRIAGLAAIAAPVLLGACASGPTAQEIKAAEAVESKFGEALSYTELRDEDIDEGSTIGDYWGTGTVASVQEDGSVIYRVPTSLVEGTGADAYANRQQSGERDRYSQTLSPYVLRTATNNPLMTPNQLRIIRSQQMTLGTQPERPNRAPQATPAPAPRPAVSPSRSGPRPARSMRNTQRRSIESRN